MLTVFTESIDIFFVKGFLYKDLIEEIFIVVVPFCIFPICNIFNFLISFSFYNCNLIFVIVILPIVLYNIL